MPFLELLTQAMVFDKSAQKYGVMALFDQPIAGQADSPFVLQYEVTLGAGMECGGAYVKLVDAAAGVQPDVLDNDTPYIVMFGPDRCGGTNKLHFIVRHQNPVSKEWEEKHLKNPPAMKDGTNPVYPHTTYNSTYPMHHTPYLLHPHTPCPIAIPIPVYPHTGRSHTL